jgi:DNA-binding SARP family transcriptional activator
MAQPTLGVLGAVVAWGHDGAELGLKGKRQRAVLARLVVARRRVVPVRRLVAELWAEPGPGAVGALQTFVGELRKALEPDRPPRAPAKLLVTEGPGYALRLAPDAVDAWRFEDAVAAAAKAPPEQARERLTEALALWRGPAYADFAHEEWARADRSRLAELRLRAVEQRAGAQLALGLAAEAVPDLDAHVAEHPWREDAWRLLALALYRSARQGEALAVLRRAREALVDGLGVDPGPALRRLEADVLAQDPRLDEPPGAAARAARLWTRAAEAYDRTVAAGARARLESTVGLIRNLAVTGGDGLAAAREHRLPAIRAAEEFGDPVLTARVIGAYDVPAIWPRSDDPDQAAQIVAAAERTLAALPRTPAHTALRCRLLTTIALESRATPPTPTPEDPSPAAQEPRPAEPYGPEPGTHCSAPDTLHGKDLAPAPEQPAPTDPHHTRPEPHGSTHEASPERAPTSEEPSPAEPHSTAPETHRSPHTADPTTAPATAEEPVPAELRNAPPPARGSARDGFADLAAAGARGRGSEPSRGYGGEPSRGGPGGAGSAEGRAEWAAREAEAIARRLDDPALLAFALNGVFVQSCGRAGLAGRRDEVGAELVGLAARYGLVTYEVLGHLIRMQARSALDDLPGADGHAAAVDALAERYELPLAGVFTRWYRAMRVAAGPDTGAAEAAYREAAAALAGSGMPGVERGLLPLALLSLRLRPGSFASAVPYLRAEDDFGPYRRWVEPLLRLAAGRTGQARAALDALPEPPADLFYEALCCLQIAAALELGALPRLRQARDRLAPAAGQLAGAGSAVLTLGPVDAWLAAADRALG